MRAEHTEVLVVGAGPVGMSAALFLAREGVQVQIMDQAPGVAGQSYACGLHSRTLLALQEVGLHDQLVERGRRVDKIAFYEGTSRRAEIPFEKVTPQMPFMLVLPQNELETLLEQTLARERLNVRWNHRLSDVLPANGGVAASVDQLTGTATGYDVPRWETMVERTIEVQADFVLGCDGQHSAVRRAAGIEEETLGKPELYVVYEFDSDFELPPEIRVVLNPTDTNVLWPVGDRRFRWSFQWTDTPADGEFPAKDRSHFWFEDKPVAQRTQAHLENMLRQRAPWFDGKIENMDWATDVRFERRLAKQFGRMRCWLAGDAAHQTGPVGMQSMNIGIREAFTLARQVASVLRDQGSVSPLEDYESEFMEEWQRLLGITTEVVPAENSGRKLRTTAPLMSCLPASGVELERMLECLGLRLNRYSAPTAQRR